MAFKIESISKMRDIASTMSEYSSNANSESQKVLDAISELSSSISGQGVEDTLQKLRDSVTTNTESAVSTLEYVSLFINSQASSYAQNEEQASSTLSNVQSTLDSIQI